MKNSSSYKFGYPVQRLGHSTGTSWLRHGPDSIHAGREPEKPCPTAFNLRLAISSVICLIFFSCQSSIDAPAPTSAPVNASYSADRYEVSVGQFREFIAATGYHTTADTFMWSGVFDDEIKDWKIVENANWERHDGIEIAGDEMPVVHVSYFDACAFCSWRGGRLPSADEWDLLAGDTVITGNVWQGIFPEVDQGLDGYKAAAAPRGQFMPNAGGYHDLFGNVWEWTTSMHPVKNERIIKGGSFLCDYNVCQGYIPSRYQTTADDSGLNHLGFRCVYDKNGSQDTTNPLKKAIPD